MAQGEATLKTTTPSRFHLELATRSALPAWVGLQVLLLSVAVFLGYPPPAIVEPGMAVDSAVGAVSHRTSAETELSFPEDLKRERIRVPHLDDWDRLPREPHQTLSPRPRESRSILASLRVDTVPLVGPTSARLAQPSLTAPLVLEGDDLISKVAWTAASGGWGTADGLGSRGSGRGAGGDCRSGPIRIDFAFGRTRSANR